ncbi:MAG: hypothetical protein RRY65_06430 [Pseudoflavonifractor sp.]
MELMMKDGDYVSDGNGGFRRAEGADALLQRVLWKLTVRRGSFPFLPELGSCMYLLLREKPRARLTAAKQYISQALADEPELNITDVRLDQGEDGSMELTVELEQDGEKRSGTVVVTG